ncbi:adenylate/guanylate cyclase domain-containing protein [Coleofasciculus sp. E2-BRE-01]|uniref:adenylate/guanylate cyclase domain-containing protein n=1 Tax=Coleofasciculus sp. E2-BRE-01 TaxID=3069524 RepID=UPI0032FC0010
MRNIGIAAGGTFLWVILFIKAQTINFSQHHQYLSNLHQLQETDATLNTDILQAQQDSFNDPETILNDLSQIDNLHHNLEDIPDFVNREYYPEIKSALQQNRSLFQDKQVLIEEVIKQETILNQSLKSLPNTIQGLSSQVATEPGADALINQLNTLLNDVLIYTLSPSDELILKIQRQMAAIRQRADVLTASSALSISELDAALIYAEIIVTHESQVDSLVMQILELPTEQQSEQILDIYQQSYQVFLRKTKIYRILFYVVSGLIAATLFIVLILKTKQLTQNLQKCEEKYRSSFDNSVEGIFKITPSGRFLTANTTLATLYGYASAEEVCDNLVNLNRQLYVQPNRHDELVRILEKYGSVSDFESQIYRKNGTKIWIEEKARAVRDNHGNFIYYEGTVEDITVRKAWQEALHYEQEQAERLLLNILPKVIAQRLKQLESTIADNFDEVTVLFADIVGFTELSARFPPAQVVELLNRIFSAFDELSDYYGLEKIKTIGDAYMVVGGLPTPRPDHAEATANMALDMQQVITKFNNQNNQTLSIRIGINTGPVVAGVIGIKKFSYDLWGDTVNIASRMESQGLPDKIQVTEFTYKKLQDNYLFEERGTIQVKGKGKMTTYFLKGKIN